MARRKSILIVNTFPIAHAQTGGQKRQEALVKAYQTVFDRVQYVGVFFKEHYKHYAPTDIALPRELYETMWQSPHTGDIVCGNAIYENPTVKAKMTAVLMTLQPDVIQIEQVFPYFGMKCLLEELNMHPKIVFSSHNVEAPHKREILESVGMPKSQIDPIVDQIAAVERDLACNSELVIACTESDRAFYERQGARNTVLARNGMGPIVTTGRAIAHWKRYYADRYISKTALFVGSAHPPNWNGITKMVGDGMGFMPFDARLVLAGGICDYFERTMHEEYNYRHLTFWQRVLALGRLDDDSLGAIIKLADAIVLPITEGGGSNLKTAEAVLSGRPVVGTSHAFRSFEELQYLPNIYIADTPKEFRKAIVQAMSSPILPRNPEEVELAESVLWSRCLQLAAEKVGEL